jgi:hypothetical protein
LAVKVPVTVNDLLDGHVALDIECLDRIYLNGYVPNLQVSGQVVTFLTRHLAYPIASPAIFEKIGTRFRDDVRRDAAARGVPMVRFAKGDRKIDVMRPLLAKAAATGRSQLVAVGVAQEFQRVFTGANGAGVGEDLPRFRTRPPTTTHPLVPGATILRRSGPASRPSPLRGSTSGRALTPTPHRRLSAPSRARGRNRSQPVGSWGLTRPRSFRDDRLHEGSPVKLEWLRRVTNDLH